MFVARSTGFSGTIQRSSNATLELYRLGETGDILSNRPNTGYHLESGAAIGHWWGPQRAPSSTWEEACDQSTFHGAAGAVLPRMRASVRLGHTGPRRYTRSEPFSCIVEISGLC